MRRPPRDLAASEEAEEAPAEADGVPAASAACAPEALAARLAVSLPSAPVCPDDDAMTAAPKPDGAWFGWV